MNFNPASVVAAAAAAAHNHHQHQPHIIPLPTFSSSSHSNSTAVLSIGVAGIGGGSLGGDTSPKTMEWTNDDALELIEQYRCHTELWNRADPKYKDKLCRFRAWSEIAERFGCSKAEVERKMNVLLTQYRREKHKMFVKIYQGIQPNPSKWYAFKRFDFMEAGGGSLSGLPSGGGGGGSGANAATPGHNGLNGLAAAAAAAAAYESSTIAAAGNGGATGGSGATTTTPAAQHRRIKTKEMKYFGAMGLNIPMLIATGQTLDSWNTVGQYSPPIGGSSGAGAGTAVGVAGSGAANGQLRVQLPLSYGSSAGAASSHHYASGGGGSSSSEFQPSPHKTMDTSDTEDNNNKEDAALGTLAAKQERRTPVINAVGGGPGSSVSSLHDAAEQLASMSGEAAAAGLAGSSETGSSPIPNTNTHEAHKNHRQQQQQLSSPSARAATPRNAHEQHHAQLQHLQAHQLQHHPPHTHHQHDLEIKQELVDYFHTPAGSLGVPAPAPPDSHRSYSSAEESRLHAATAEAGSDADFAQDLRVAAAAKAAAATPSLGFGHFVLPGRNSAHRRSNSGDSLLEEKYATSMPLNMRKLNAAAAAAAVGSSAAGHMLMNSLMSSRESMSDADVDNDEATESAASPGHQKSSVSAQDASSAAAAAAALYAESLSRDDCDFIGSNVSMKLRTMDRTQRIIAEKLISEVLYYGQFNELERTARIQPK